MTETCKVAFIGAGGMAREHVRAFRDVAGVEVGGIFSRTRARAEALAAEFNVPRVYDSVSELNAGTMADLVVVAVDELSMRAVCQASFEYPWKLLIEKPPGYNLADAVAIDAAAKASRRLVWVGLNRRFLSSTRAALDDLNTSAAPRFIHVQDQQDQAAALASGQPDLIVQNWMFANSIHLVDYLHVFGRGPVKSVTRVIPWNRDDPGVVLAKVDFEGGDQGLYEGVWHGPGPWAVSVTTAKRRWELRPLEQASFQNAGERRRYELEPHAWDQEFKPGFRRQAQQIVNAVVGRPTQASSLSDALATMQLIDEIFSA